MSVELATAYVSLVPSMKGAQGAIASALSDEAGPAADRAGALAGGRLTGAFKKTLGVAAIVGAVVGSAAGLYKVGSIFDDVSDTIRVGTGETGDALTGLSDIAKNVANTIPTSFEQAGSTVADLRTRLGLTGDTLQTVASQYIQAGNVLGEDVDIQSTTAAFSAFGIQGDAVSGAMDQLFRVSQSTGVGMNELAASVQKNAPAVQNLGFSFSDTAALAGSLDKAGLNTGQVMGALSKSLVTLSKDGEKPADAFHRTVDELKGFIDAGDTASAINLAGKVFGAKGASQLVGAIQSGTLALDDLTGAANLSSDTILGVGADTADFAESWTLVKNNALSAIEPLGTAIFNLAGGAMGAVAAKAQELGPKISAGLSSGLEKVGPVLSSVGKTIGPVFASIGSALGPLLGSLGAALGPLIGPVLQLWQAFSPLSLILQVLAPVLPQLASLFGVLATTIGGTLVGILSSLLNALSPVVSALTGTLSQALVTLMPLIVQVATMLGATLTQVLSALAPIVGQLALALGGALVGVLSALSPLFGVVAGLILTVLNAILPLVPVVLGLVAAIAPLVAQLISALAPVLVAIVPLFAAIIAAIAPLISTIIGVLIPVIEALLPVITTVFGVIVNIITAALQIVQGIIQVVTGAITGNWSQVWAGLGNIIAGAWNLITSVISGALGIVKSVIGAALSVVGSIVAAGFNGLIGVVSGAWNGITSAISSGVSSAVSFVSALPGRIVSALSSLNGLLVSVGSNMMQGLISGVQAAAGRIKDAVLGPIKNSVDAVKSFLGIHSPSRLFAEIGGYIGDGLKKGLDGSASGVSKATKDLAGAVSKSFGSGEINATVKQSVLQVTDTLTRGLKRLANQQDKLLDRIKAAREKVLDLRKDKADYATSVRDAVTGAVDAGDQTTAGGYVANLQNQIAQTKRFTAVLATLKKKGLDKATYDELAQGGVDSLSVAQSIADSGKAGIAEIAKLKGQLGSAGSVLGKSTSNAMYDAGIQAATGILRGLQSQESVLVKQMRRLADRLVTSIKQALGIHSPSRVLRDQVGTQIGAGLESGIRGQFASVEAAMQELVRIPPASTFAPRLTTPTLAAQSAAGADAGSGGKSVSLTVENHGKAFTEQQLLNAWHKVEVMTG